MDRRISRRSRHRLNRRASRTRRMLLATTTLATDEWAGGRNRRRSRYTNQRRYSAFFYSAFQYGGDASVGADQPPSITTPSNMGEYNKVNQTGYPTGRRMSSTRKFHRPGKSV